MAARRSKLSRRRKRREAGEPEPPPFPRKQWTPGQTPRTEKPKKGRGSYDRQKVKRVGEE